MASFGKNPGHWGDQEASSPDEARNARRTSRPWRKREYIVITPSTKSWGGRGGGEKKKPGGMDDGFYVLEEASLSANSVLDRVFDKDGGPKARRPADTHHPWPQYWTRWMCVLRIDFAED